MINIWLMSLASIVAATESSSVGAIINLILVILTLIALNGLFVAAEFSILGSRPSRMEQLAQEGHATAGRLVQLLESAELQNRYLATAQLGITVVTIGLAIYAEPQVAALLEPLLARWFGITSEAALHTVGYFVSIGLLTYLHVVLGEMVPKSVALAQANEVALWLDRPMRLLQALFAWPIRFLNWVGQLLLQLVGVPLTPSLARLYSPEEIEQIVTESTESGLFSEDAQEMIQNIFDFSERTVGEVMTPRPKVEALPVDIPYDELIRRTAGSRRSRFPVYDGDLDHVIGILHLKDLIRCHVNQSAPCSLRELLRPAPVAPEDLQVEALLTAFKRQRLHMAIVLDEFGGLAGIVTLEDLVEEVVGEVRDEFDVEPEPYVEVAPGLLEVTGDYLLDYLKEDVYLGEEEDLPEVDTVGGLIVTRLGRPAEVGDVVNLTEGVALTVLAVDGRAVGRVRVTFPTPSTSDGAGPPTDHPSDPHSQTR